MNLNAQIERLIEVGALERDPVTGDLAVHPALSSLVARHNNRLATDRMVATIPAGRG